MFLINISLQANNLDEKTAAEYFARHRTWFAKFFERGDFILLGPYLDKEHSGMIIAKTKGHEQLQAILAEDVYYPLGLADYEVREFNAVMIQKGLTEFVNQ